MPLDTTDGVKALQLITSRYDQREWRKKIEKTLSLSPKGLGDEIQRKIFLYLKIELQAYKSRRADHPSWIVGGYATREVIDRARYNPTHVDPTITKDQVALLGVDPGPEVDEGWWEEMLVKWFEEPEEEEERVESEEETPSQVEQEEGSAGAE